MHITFKPITTPKQVEELSILATVIWVEHYTPIIGEGQVEYMLNTYHSFHTIKKELQEKSTHYYFIIKEYRTVGYIGVKLEEKNLFLSKFYVVSKERGIGVGGQAMTFIKKLALDKTLKQIILTVNKNNSNAIQIYKKMGFTIRGEICADIGQGYVMDDYEMALKVEI